MPLELQDPDLSTKPAFPGNKGFLVLAKLRGMRNVHRETLKRLRALTVEYCKAKYPEELEKTTNGNGTEEEPKEEKMEEETSKDEEKEKETTNEESNSFPDSVIKFGPHELMYENCCFITSNLVDPSDYAHFCMAKLADDPEWPQPRFPLRIMPVQEISCLTPRDVERAARPLLEKVFAGDESLRFSIIFHGKIQQDSKEMPRQSIEAVVRNIIWSINPNCVQCIKYQDYAVLLEVVDPLLFMGIAKEFNQLGRYNTSAAHHGRDLKDQEEFDSEDEISDDPELTEADNIKRKLRIKKKRRAEKEAEAKAKQAKVGNGGDGGDDDVLGVGTNGN